MKMLTRLLLTASICLLIACTAAATPPSVDHTDNYTVVLTYGQTPYQMGYRASGNVTAWNWWDTGDGMQQQNLILAMVLDKTAHPVGGLSQPSFSLSQTRFRAGLNTYSLKADNDGTGNYSNNMNIWHWIPLDLVGHSNTELTFYTWYRIVPGDYGYVKVSTDGGHTWTELANYTKYQTGMPVKQTISLSAYDGEDILLAFNFVSDSSGVDEGWYIDDIKVVANGIQFFNWRLFGSTIFKDGATSTPPALVVDISYPSYYSARTEKIKLQEYSKGLYGGIFYYATNETYSGRYEIKFNNEINGTDPLSVTTTFDTTLWGCQASNCHDAWSPTDDPSIRNPCDVIHPDNITSSTATNCLTACHTPSASQFLRATPLHLHEIVYGHYGGFVCGDAGWIEIFDKPNNVNVQMYRDTSVKRPLVQGAFNQSSHASATATVGCIDCHTKFVHDKTGSVQYNVAPPTTLHGTNITYGVHSNVSCEKCHGSLTYPKFTSSAHSLKGSLNGYVPEFMSYKESTGTYIIDVNGTTDINVTVVADDTDHEFLLSLVGPVNSKNVKPTDLNVSDPWRGTYMLPSVDGAAIFRAGGKICYPYGEYLNVVTFDTDSPEPGAWVVRVLSRSTGKFNYTITSNYAIAQKPIIHIPWNCSECHQANPPAGCEGAGTNLTIPDWDNYGLAYTHTDIDGDGNDDVTCRACHNALHDVG
ncbi:MAG: immune inhibitor A, partial [Euryarchaeota archaeon]|nr:immune inhibitor A [Euryarchaeota archaeon]